MCGGGEDLFDADMFGTGYLYFGYRTVGLSSSDKGKPAIITMPVSNKEIVCTIIEISACRAESVIYSILQTVNKAEKLRSRSSTQKLFRKEARGWNRKVRRELAGGRRRERLPFSFTSLLDARHQ